MHQGAITYEMVIQSCATDPMVLKALSFTMAEISLVMAPI